MTNPIIESMLNRASIREYTDQPVPKDVLTSIVRAGQQAPFAYQFGSLLLSRKQKHNPFKTPLLFTVCVDIHRFEQIAAMRNWKVVQNDLSLLLFGIQDAALMAENLVIAAESYGLGSCFLGAAPYHAQTIFEEYKLPKRVFPLVQLAMGYPAEDPPPRPRYPIDFCLFEDEYPSFSEDMIVSAMEEMDEGYLAQDYYRRAGVQIPLQGDRQETFTFEDYSWTEHTCRKTGQWHLSLDDLLEPLSQCGFRVAPAP